MPIVYKRPDGGISTCMPCVSSDDPPGFTLDQAYERALKNNIPDDASHVYRFEHGVLPEQDVFRDAWSHVDESGNVTYDMSAAKSIIDKHLQREMKTHLDKKNLIENLGRDAAETEKDISDCRSRLVALDKMQMPDKHDMDLLANMKSLIKA